MTMFFGIILVAVTSVLVMTHVDITDAVSQAWFSQYGDPGFARKVSDGTDWGRMSKFRCSLKCERSSSCSAFQYKEAAVSVGSCVVFNARVFRNRMFASPGTQYYEKRRCALTMHVDAAMFYEDYYSPWFSGTMLRLHLFTTTRQSDRDPPVITGMRVIGDYTISDIYPGYHTTVDAAFVMPGSVPSVTIFLKGTNESCFQRPGTRFTFYSCGTSTYLNQFFDETGLDHVDTIAAYGESDLHVTAIDKVYHLRFHSGANTYFIAQSYDLLAQTSQNPWSHTFKGMTAMFRLITVDGVYFLIERDKFVIYSTDYNYYYSSPDIQCK